MGYLMRPGTKPGIALYSSCEDVLLCQAELMVLLGKTPNDGKVVFGYYDVVPSMTISRFKRGYRGRPADYRSLMVHRQDILANGWPFPDMGEESEGRE